MSIWSLERDDSFGDRDVWRVVDGDDAARWSDYRTSARCPYVATVYDRDVAQRIVDSHNNTSIPSGTNHRALMQVLDDWRLSQDNDGKLASAHEGAARLRERLDWLWDDVKADRPRDYLRARARELAAMALRFVAECTDEGESR